MGFDSTLGEHIRLALKVTLIVKYLKGAKQTITAIVTESKVIATGEQTPVFLYEIIVKGVQLFLLTLDDLIGIVLGLVLNKLPHAISQENHTPYTVLGSQGEICGVHTAVFTEIQLAVHYRVTEITHVGICGNR